MSLEWRDKMSVDDGGPIDQDHQYFFTLFNKIEADFTNYKKETMLKHLASLEYFCTLHFTQEEGIMDKIGYPNIAEHKKEHEKITKTVKGIIAVFSKDIDPTKLEEVHGNMMMLMRSWIIGHNMAMDMQLVPYIKEYRLKRTGFVTARSLK